MLVKKVKTTTTEYFYDGVQPVPTPSPSPSPTPTPTPSPTPTPTMGSGEGLMFEGFSSDTDCIGSPDYVDVRPLPDKDTFGHEWDQPTLASPRSNYSFRYSGFVTPDFTEPNLTLTLSAKSGVRLWWDGSRLFDEWVDPGSHTHWDKTFTVSVTKGKSLAFKYEGNVLDADGRVSLKWSSPSHPIESLPGSLCSPPAVLVKAVPLTPPAPPTPGPVPQPTPTPPADLAPSPNLLGIPLLSPSSLVYEDISTQPVDPNSAKLLAAYDLSGTAKAHADFNGVGNGYPINEVDNTTPKVSVTFDVASESDPGPYPIPDWVQVENGMVADDNDHHCLIYHRDEKKLYELFQLRKVGSTYYAYSGSIFDCTKGDGQRPAGWTSSVAGGCAVTPLLVKFDECNAAGSLTPHDLGHCLPITVPHTRRAYQLPCSHVASTDRTETYLPMGAKLRLKASYDVTQGGTANLRCQAIGRTMQVRGAMVMDNGALWHVQGNCDVRWGTDPNNQETVNYLRKITTNDLEVVQLKQLTVPA